jgi:hypothetical protein
MGNVNNVSAAKPNVSGAIFRAPLTTTLPTTADETLDTAFKDLGFIGEDGVTNNNTATTSDIKAWGGQTVLNLQTDKPDTFKFRLIEYVNPEVLKTIYGDDNVSGTLAAGIAVVANSDEQENKVWVIDSILKGGVLDRIVIPQGVVSEVGEIQRYDGGEVGCDITIKALPDSSGNTHYEYIKES